MRSLYIIQSMHITDMYSALLCLFPWAGNTSSVKVRWMLVVMLFMHLQFFQGDIVSDVGFILYFHQ